MVESRIAERRAGVRAAQRRARLRRTLLVLLLVLLLAGGVWYERSEHGTVREVVVTGLVRLDAEDVLEVSRVAAAGS